MSVSLLCALAFIARAGMRHVAAVSAGNVLTGKRILPVLKLFSFSTNHIRNDHLTTSATTSHHHITLSLIFFRFLFLQIYLKSTGGAVGANFCLCMHLFVNIINVNYIYGTIYCLLVQLGVLHFIYYPELIS